MQKRRTVFQSVTPEIKVLVSVDEAAAMLSLGRSLVYDLVRKGELLSIKIGRNRRIPVTALHDYIGRQLAHAS
jgi:excisionase family DNA binding protein